MWDRMEGMLGYKYCLKLGYLKDSKFINPEIKNSLILKLSFDLEIITFINDCHRINFPKQETELNSRALTVPVRPEVQSVTPCKKYH